MPQEAVPQEAVLEENSVTSWSGPFDDALRERAASALEAGQVLVFPNLSFAVQPAEAAFLRPQSGDGSRKNISFDHTTGKLGGTSLEGEDAATLSGMMDRYGKAATRLLSDLVPGYAPHLERARTSFRPVDVSDRPSSRRKDDRLLHVDAFPTRPLRGRRILRVFSNIAPDGAVRHWEVGEPFADFAGRFLPQLRQQRPGEAWALRTFGLTKGTRTAYDHLMLQLHDAGKLDEVYQKTAPHHAVSFPPGTSWMCFTDSVLHAALAGRFAVEQTFHLPVEAMLHPEQAPLRVLERLAGRALA